MVLLGTGYTYLTVSCPDPTPAHGWVHTTGESHTQFLHGDKVFFSCEPEYIRPEGYRIECTRDGSWSSPPPVCIGNQHY